MQKHVQKCQFLSGIFPWGLRAPMVQFFFLIPPPPPPQKWPPPPMGPLIRARVGNFAAAYKWAHNLKKGKLIGA
jgi:hypothetical protein